ncbi:hypothetical protein DFH11DRAFT_1726382 [Phellopilus nigrolimitatus]|nr:hypothetical protein DFH11DRAFT_1726382 [Phellopilus nigrolimitatus]
MARIGPITNLPQSILRDAGKLRIFATSFETVRPPFSVQKRGSLMSGISVSEACLPEALNKIVGAGQPVAPLVGRPEILVCVNWPGYSHVITRHQVKQYLIMHYTTLAGFVGAVGEQLADYIEVAPHTPLFLPRDD